GAPRAPPTPPCSPRTRGGDGERLHVGRSAAAAGASRRQGSGDRAMDAGMAAIAAGGYAEAYEGLQDTAEAQTQTGKAVGALLLALIERFDEADQLLEAADVPAFRVILQGERQRATRWRDPEANGSLNATDETPLIPMYVAIATAFVHDNQHLADQAKAK